MAALASLLPDIQPDVAGCPAITIRHELLRAAQDFFRRSRAWRVRTAALAVAANQASVTIVLSAGQEPVRAEEAYLDGRHIFPATDADLSAANSGDWQSATGTPRNFMQLMPGSVRLYPVPAAAATTGLVLEVSVAPADAATTIPDDLLIEHRNVLISGALASLFLQPKRSWSDPALGAYHRDIFETAVSVANYKRARAGGAGRIASRAGWC